MQCWHARRPNAHSMPFWESELRSSNVMIKRVSLLMSGGFWYVPVNDPAHAFSCVGEGRLFQHLQATWQPLQAVHLEESKKIAISLIVYLLLYAFSMFTRNALYSGMKLFGSPTFGVRSFTMLSSVPKTPAHP